MSRTVLVFSLAVLALAALFSLAGAYDTDSLGFARRLALWTVLGGLMLGQALTLDSVFARLAPPGLGPRLLAGAAAAAGTLALVTLEVFFLKQTPLTPPVWGDDPLLDLVPNVAPPVLVLAAGVMATRLWLQGWRTISYPETEARFLPRRSRIAGLLPPPAAPALSDWPAGEVISVRAQDHYLEIATVSGAVFVRGRMRDAVGRLAGADGMQVHRSWWVARKAVREARREGRDVILVLADGREAPVGRDRLRALRAGGWL